MFIEIIVIFSFFTGGKLQPTELKHYLSESELRALIKNVKHKFKDANISVYCNHSLADVR